MEKLQFITGELNRLFAFDHNCSSFNALEPSQLLQVVIDVMANLQLTTDNRPENPAYVILHVLNTIKYTPGEIITPEDFRNGLIDGKKNILHPLLYFLLNNQETVKLRHYLSRFVNKLEVPDEYRDGTWQKYEEAIDLFWDTYKDNKKSKALAAETSELEEDLYKMRSDLRNLNARIHSQKSKLTAENRDGKRYEAIKKYCTEFKQFNKHQKLLKEEQISLNELKETNVLLQNRKRIANLENLLEQAESNRDITNNLQKSLLQIEPEENLYSQVSNESNPSRYELDYFENQNIEYEASLNGLLDQKDSTCEVFINQLKTFSKKRQIIIKQIEKIKLSNDLILLKIENICSLLGGDVLQGRSLKDYITKLREMSVVYKKLKIQWNGLQAELGILSRTLEILKLENPDLNSCDTKVGASSISRERIELQSKEYEKLRSAVLLIEIERNRKNESYHILKDDYEAAKTAFDVAAGGLRQDIEALDKNYTDIQFMIELEMDKLNKYVEEAEKYKESLLMFSQAEIDAGDYTYLEMVKDKLELVRDRHENLKLKLEENRKRDIHLQDEILKIKHCIEMVKSKG